MFPSHSVPEEFVMTTTFGTSRGPTQPLIVNWTGLSIPRFRHSFFSHSTGTPRQPTLRIAATATLADRNLTDHEAFRLNGVVPVRVHLSEPRGSNLVKLRMNANSEVT